MDLLSRIASWLGENEATISAVVGITVLAGVVLAGLRSLVLRRGETTAEKAPSPSSPEPISATDSSPADLDPLTVPGFEGRPAIAVLAFDNLSGDPEQEYFADGIAEDLITRLSHWRWFPVIARNSSFTYKGKPVDVRRVSRELGVRYIVEGSVRKAGGRVRISAQLIDATTAAHVWADQYDRELEDVFAIQDEITEAIAGAMQPGLWQVEQEHARRRPTHDLTAWDCSQRGFWLLLGGTGTTAEVRTLFQRAVELDPDFALAFVGLALTHLVEFWMDWTGPNEEALAGLVRAAEKSVRLDGQLALAHCVMGYAQYLTGQPQKAVASLERAVELDPSLAIAHAWLGDALCSAGRADEAIPNVEKAMRMSPHDPMKWSFLFIIGQAHAYRGRFEEAIHCFEESFRLRPQWPPTLIWTTAIYAHLGRQDEARDALGRLVQVWPAVSLSTIRVSHAGFVDPVALERILDGLRKAGMGE